jgi:hypothetical protein
MLSKKRPPTIKDTDRLVAEIYRDINEIIDSVNRPSDLGGRETEGRTGALRLVRLDKNQRFVEFRFEDGWHQIRTTDTNIISNAEVVPPATDHHHDDRYSKLDHHHDDRYSLLSHLHDDRYSLLGHTHLKADITDFTHGNESHSAYYITYAEGDARYGQLAAINSWQLNNYFLDKVGIGTTNPEAKLHVSGAVNANGTFSAVGNSAFIVQSTGNQQLRFFIDETNKSAAIQSVETTVSNNRSLLLNPVAGNVGIGTTGPGEKLHVEGFARTLSGYKVGTTTVIDSNRDGFLRAITGDSFASGWAGSGWRLTSGAELELNNLRVRGRLDVYELIVNQIRATNGNLFVTSSAKVTSASSIGAPNYRMGLEDNLIPFAVDDLLRAQRFTGSGVYQSNVKVIFISPGVYMDVELISGDAPAAGMVYVRLGNTTTAARQGSVYLTSEDSDAPFIDIADGVAAFGDWGASSKIKVRLGKLDGITDTDFPGMSGYGLYTDNAYLKGTIVAGSGLIGGWAIDTTRIWKRLEYTGYNIDTILRANEAGEQAGLQIFREESSTRRMMIQVGRLIGTNYSWTSNWGINFIARLGSSTERKLFEISQNHTDPLNFNAQIAGWSFDWSKFWTGSGSDFVGMQQRATSTTRVFYAGATDNTGANAVFYVQANGMLFHPSIVSLLLSQGGIASNSLGATALTAIEWRHANATLGCKAVVYYIHRLGMSNIVLKYQRRLTNGSDTGRIRFSLRPQGGGTPITVTDDDFTGSTVYTDQSLTISVSGLTHGTVYLLDIFIGAWNGPNPPSGEIQMRGPSMYATGLSS